MTTTSDTPTEDYEGLFQQYVSRSVQATYTRLQTDTQAPLSEQTVGRAKNVLDFALKLDVAWPETRNLLLGLAPRMEQAGHRDDWLHYLDDGITLSQGCEDKRAEAELRLRVGQLHYLCSRFDQAQQQLASSLTLFAFAGDATSQARTHNELAWLAHLEHQYTEATAHVEQALALLNEDDPERAMSYRVQGMIAIDQERWQEAEKFHRQALTLFENQGNLRRIAGSVQNLAYALRGQKRFEEAVSYCQQAATMLDRLADAYSLGVVQITLGGIYYHLNKAAQALLSYKHAEIIFNRLHDRLMIAKINTGLGLSHLALGEYTQAENAFSSSIRLFGELQDDSLRLNATDGLVMVYLASKQYAQAIEVTEQALHDLSDIASAPNYNYLLQSVNTHLAEARQGQEVTMK